MPPEEVNTTDEELLADEPEEVKPEPKESEEEPTVEAPEPEEEEEKEEDKEEEVEEEDEVETSSDFLHERPSIQDIKGKYPNFFKDFPELRDAFFREQKYTELFPTIEDARDALTDSEAFTTLRESVLSGDPVPLFESIEKSDKEALTAFASNFLPTLYKRDSKLYSQVITPLLENVTKQVFAAGKSSDNENLANAALVLSQYLFDTTEVASGKKTTVTLPQKDEKLEADRRAFENEKFRHFHSGVLGEGEEKLVALINDGFDPKGVFSPFLKKQCVKEIMAQIDSALQADANHMTVMKARWERAKREGYNGDSKAKIISAYLARAKSLLPSIREKVQNEALGTKKQASKHQESTVTSGKKEIVNQGAASNGKIAKVSPKQIDWNKTSDLDFLNDKITLRR